MSVLKEYLHKYIYYMEAGWISYSKNVEEGRRKRKVMNLSYKKRKMKPCYYESLILLTWI